jgi:hypothetical protein
VDVALVFLDIHDCPVRPLEQIMCHYTPRFQAAHADCVPS